MSAKREPVFEWTQFYAVLCNRLFLLRLSLSPLSLFVIIIHRGRRVCACDSSAKNMRSYKSFLHLVFSPQKWIQTYFESSAVSHRCRCSSIFVSYGCIYTPKKPFRFSVHILCFIIIVECRAHSSVREKLHQNKSETNKNERRARWLTVCTCMKMLFIVFCVLSVYSKRFVRLFDRFAQLLSLLPMSI